MDRKRLIRWALTLFAVVAFVHSSSSWAVGDETSDSGGLVLDIYVDDAGKALVTGYAKSIEGLSFLNDSEYQYDDTALQLYAVTNALTVKNGDDWEISLPAEGIFGEYHVTIYLSENVQLSNITSTEGLDYLVSSSSDSLVVEFHGYDVASPSASVRYRQPVGDEGAQEEASTPPTAESSILPIVLVGGVIIALVVFSAFKLRGKGEPASPPPEEVSSPSGAAGLAPESQERGDELAYEDEADHPPASADLVPTAGEETRGALISGEMAAVMETLTERERSVLEALMKHEGKMTQADIRYETGIPKSSLTGIIVSLERRNIVTKKEWGRTNVIELSERLTRGGR